MTIALLVLALMVVYLVLGLGTLWLRITVEPDHFDVESTGYSRHPYAREKVRERAVCHVVLWPAMLPATIAVCVMDGLLVRRQRELDAAAQTERELAEARKEVDRLLGAAR